jgi:hypothetical protein
LGVDVFIVELCEFFGAWMELGLFLGLGDDYGREVTFGGKADSILELRCHFLIDRDVSRQERS